MIRTRAIPTLLVLVLSACAVAAEGKRASPTEWGFSFQAVPAFDVGDSGDTSVHPVLAYNYLNWDGGHDNIYQVGAQVRRSLPDGPMWFGGEFAFDRFTSSTSGADFDEPSWNGFSLGGLFGYELDTEFAPSSVFGSLSYLRFGSTDFEGATVGGWDGWLFRVGFEVQPDLFNR